MSSPKLVIGYGGNQSTRSNIEGILRANCHIDLIDRVQARHVDASNPWSALPPNCDILLHPSISKGLRKNIKSIKIPGYEVIVECPYKSDFKEILISRLRALSLHWRDRVPEIFDHWNHDNTINEDRIVNWANQFGSPLGEAILSCLRIIRTNQLLPSIGVESLNYYDAIVAITDERGEHSGSEHILKGVLAGKNKNLQKLEELTEFQRETRRVLIVSDWLLSGRQFLAYLGRSKDRLKSLSGNGVQFHIGASRITQLAKVRVERALEMLGITNFRIIEPTEGFLPNLPEPLELNLHNDSLIPTEVVGDGQITTELEMRLRQIGYPEKTIQEWRKASAEMGYSLLYQEPRTRGERKPICWGLGNDGLGLTTLTCGTEPPSLLPVIWASGTLHLNNKLKRWVPLIARSKCGD